MKASHNLKGNAVYWPPVGTGDEGQQTYGTAVQIKVHWEDRAEQFLGRGGDVETSSATVYVDRDLEELGVLFRGTVAGLTSSSDPFANATAWVIRKFNKLPNRRETDYERSCFMGNKRA